MKTSGAPWNPKALPETHAGNLYETSINVFTLLADTGLQGWDACVLGAAHKNGDFYAIKSTPKDSHEADNLKRLLMVPCPQNHIIPAEIVECEYSYVIIMPFVSSSIAIRWNQLGPLALMEFFSQMVEVCLATYLAVYRYTNG